MAKTYTTGRNLYGIWTKNTSPANLSYGDQVANDDYRHICAMRDWPFLERLRTVSTTAATQFTTLPYDCDQVREISVLPLGSTIRYTPVLISDRMKWDELNLVPFTSDIPEYYFVFAGQIGLWPTPTSTGNVISVVQKTKPIDLSITDVTGTTVASIANGNTAMTVSGGLTTLMAGMWISITYTGAANTGDGQWYEISGIGSSTTLTLVRAYGGATITAGSAASTIAQLPLLPEAFHDLPWQWAAGTYWQKEADARAESFFDLHGMPAQGNQLATGRIKELISAWSSPTTELVIDHGITKDIINPNLTVSI